MQLLKYDSKELNFITRVLNSHATANGGGAIYLLKSVGNISKSMFHNNSASFWGGALCALSNSSLSISGTTFENNMADMYGGAIAMKSIGSSALNIIYSSFTNNSALNKVMGMGGGLFLGGNCSVKLSNVLLSKCHAYEGGAILINSTKSIMSDSSVIHNIGSAIYLLKAMTFQINNCTFINNSSPENGGAIICLYYCSIHMINTRFSENSAAKLGGAVSIQRTRMISMQRKNLTSKLTAHNCSFTKNVAYKGGAMYAYHSDFNISASSYINNTATEGGVALVIGNLVVLKCNITRNTAFADGGVIFLAGNRSLLLMSNCLVSNNTAHSRGGVVRAAGSKIVITSCAFKKNSAFGSGGVIHASGGITLLRNSSFVGNIAGLAGGVVSVTLSSLINITQSFCFRNHATSNSGVLISEINSTVLISDTKIIQNSANNYGAVWINTYSTLELNRSQFYNNSAQETVGVLCISNNSLFIAINSSFKGNKAYSEALIRIVDSTFYAERCTFIKNQLTLYGGTFSSYGISELKFANTVFRQNTGYGIFYFLNYHFINKLNTYRCLFSHGNISLKSNVSNFEQLAVKQKVMFQLNVFNQSHLTSQETPYASSKIFYYSFL